MTINDFAIQVVKLEAKQEQVNIAQIKEILSVINRLIPFGLFYGVIRFLKKQEFNA